MLNISLIGCGKISPSHYKSINKLKSKNIFGKIDHKILEGSLPDLKVLEIEVEEQATGEI